MTVDVSISDGVANVSIADNGPGISAGHQEEMFNKEACGLESTGTGLGLYLVQTLVDRYGGAVRYENNAPEGSIFIVELPLAADEPTSKTHSEPE